MDREMRQEWAAELLDGAPARAGSPPVSLASKPFPAVPRDDVPFFIETCHELLSPEDRSSVDAAYIRGFRNARAWLAAPREPLLEEQVGAFLLALVADVADLHEQLTRIRGASRLLAKGLATEGPRRRLDRGAPHRASRYGSQP
jgi:hypothetical protein